MRSDWLKFYGTKINEFEKEFKMAGRSGEELRELFWFHSCKILIFMMDFGVLKLEIEWIFNIYV